MMGGTTVRAIGLVALLASAAACAGSDTAIDQTDADTSVTNTTDDPATTSTTDQTSSTTTSTAADATTSSPPATVMTIDCRLTGGANRIADRDFELHLPDEVGTATNPTGVQSPLLVLLHGFAADAIEFTAATGLDRLAPTAGVVLAAPQGIGDVATWHIGGPDDPLVASDVDFLSSLVDELIASPCIDPDNVWLAGFSAGSAYTGVFGCAHVDRFRGLAMVSGLPPAICPADANTSIQITHGVDDPVVPFTGGEQTVSDDASVELDGVPESAAGWAEVAGCAEPEQLTFGDTDPSSVTAWRDCAGQAEVSLLAVSGLGHVWAGSDTPGGLDPGTPIIDAGCVILHAMTDADGDRFASCFA
jgi:polyhydroxybutyrate depolymerase